MSIPPQWLGTYTAELQKRQEARMLEEQAQAQAQDQYLQMAAQRTQQPQPQQAHPSIMTWATGGAEKLKEQLQLRLQLETLRNHDVKFNLGLAQERSKAEEHGKVADELRAKLQHEQERSEVLTNEINGLKDGQEYLLKQYEQLGRDYHQKVQEVVEVEEKLNEQKRTAEQVDSMKGELKGEMRFMEERLKERELALLAEAETFKVRLKDLEDISNSKDSLIQRMEGQVDFARGSLENAMSTNTRLETDVDKLTQELEMERKHSTNTALELGRLESAVQKGAQLYVDACSELEALSKTNQVIQQPSHVVSSGQDVLLYKLLDEKDGLLTQAENSNKQLAAQNTQLQQQLMMMSQQLQASQPLPQPVSPGRQFTPILVPQRVDSSPAPAIPQGQSQQLRLMQDELDYLRQQMQKNSEMMTVRSSANQVQQQQQLHMQQQQLQQMQQQLEEIPARAASPTVEPLAMKMQAAIADLQRLTSTEPDRPANASPQTLQAVWDKLYLARLHDSLEVAGKYKNATVHYFKKGHKNTYYDVQGAAEVLVDLAKSVPGMSGGKGLDLKTAVFDEEAGMILVAWTAPEWRATETLYLHEGNVLRHNISLLEPVKVAEAPVEEEEQEKKEQTASQALTEELLEEVAMLRRQVVSPENIAFQNELTELRSVAVQQTFDMQRMKELEAALQQSEEERRAVFEELNGLRDAETKVSFWQGKVKSLVQENEALKQDSHRIREQLVMHTVREGGGSMGELADTVGDLAVSASAVNDLKKQRDKLVEELSAERKRTQLAFEEAASLREEVNELHGQLQEERRANQTIHTRLKEESERASASETQAASLRDSTASRIADITIKREEAESTARSLSHKLTDADRRRQQAEDTLNSLRNQFASITAS